MIEWTVAEGAIMIERFGYVLLPTSDMDAAVRFYTETLGLPLKFRDGRRFAAVQCGDVTLALVGPDDPHPPSGVAPAMKTGDLAAMAERLRQEGHGAADIYDGDHERSFEVRDPSGNAIVFYQSQPRADCQG